MKKVVFFLILMAVSFSFTATGEEVESTEVMAPAEVMTPGESPDAEYAKQMQHGISRGFQNTTTGWLELPKAVHEHHKGDQRPVVRELRGLFDGIARTIARTGSGLWDFFVAFIPGQQEGEKLDPEVLNLRA